MSTILSHVSENHLVACNSCNLLWICAGFIGFKVVKIWKVRPWKMRPWNRKTETWDLDHRQRPHFDRVMFLHCHERNIISCLSTWTISARSTARVGSQSHLERMSGQALLCLRAVHKLCNVKGNLYARKYFSENWLSDSKYRIKDYHRLLVLISREMCLQAKPTPPIGRPLLWRSVDPDDPTADTSELQQTNQDILILEVWKITWNLKFPNTSCLYLFILFNQDHTF